MVQEREEPRTEWMSTPSAFSSASSTKWHTRLIVESCRARCFVRAAGVTVPRHRARRRVPGETPGALLDDDDDDCSELCSPHVHARPWPWMHAALCRRALSDVDDRRRHSSSCSESRRTGTERRSLGRRAPALARVASYSSYASAAPTQGCSAVRTRESTGRRGSAATNQAAVLPPVALSGSSVQCPRS